MLQSDLQVEQRFPRLHLLNFGTGLWRLRRELSSQSGEPNWTQGVGLMPLWVALGACGIAILCDRSATPQSRRLKNYVRQLTTRRLIGIIVIGGASFALANEILPAIWTSSKPSFLTVGDAWKKLSDRRGMHSLQSTLLDFLLEKFDPGPCFDCQFGFVAGFVGFLCCIALAVTHANPNNRLGFEDATVQVAGATVPDIIKQPPV